MYILELEFKHPLVMNTPRTVREHANFLLFLTLGRHSEGLHQAEKTMARIYDTIDQCPPPSHLRGGTSRGTRQRLPQVASRGGGFDVCPQRFHLLLRSVSNSEQVTFANAPKDIDATVVGVDEQGHLSVAPSGPEDGGLGHHLSIGLSAKHTQVKRPKQPPVSEQKSSARCLFRTQVRVCHDQNAVTTTKNNNVLLNEGSGTLTCGGHNFAVLRQQSLLSDAILHVQLRDARCRRRRRP